MAFKPARKLNSDELRDYAAGLLAAKAMSSSELRTKLRRKAADTAAVEDLIASLREYGAVDDAKFAGHFADSRAHAGQYGRRRVLADLMGKRIAPDTAKEAVEVAFAEVDEAVAVEQWLERKYRNQNLRELLQTRSKFASVYRRLLMAGFGSSSVLRVLKKLSGPAIEMDEMSAEE